METPKYYSSRGFKTGKVTIPGFDLVELPKNCFFRNDGDVKDIRKHVIKVCRQMNTSPGYIGSENHLSLAYGNHLEFTEISAGSTVKASVIMVKEEQYLLSKILSFGHESVHALIYFGLEEHIIKKLRESGFQMDPFKKYPGDEESVAMIGGFLTVYNLEKILNKNLGTILNPELNRYKLDLDKSRIL